MLQNIPNFPAVSRFLTNRISAVLPIRPLPQIYNNYTKRPETSHNFDSLITHVATQAISCA